MAVYDMPVQYREDVPVSASPVALPALPNKHYIGHFAKADWSDSNIRPLIDWATRKNCAVMVNIEDLNIPSPGGGMGSGSQRELVTDIDGMFESQVTLGLQPQDIIPYTRLDRIIPVDTRPDLVPQSAWDDQDQFLRNSCNRYLTDLGSSDANPALQPSIFVFNCIETHGSFSWYTTFRNTDASGLDDQEKRDWDEAMRAFYIRCYDIVREYFPDLENTAVLIYTNMSHGWDGNRGRERMPQQAADIFEGVGWDNYRPAELDQMRRRFLKKIQDVDFQQTGEAQRGFKTLDPGSEFARPLAFWQNIGPERQYELIYRTFTDSITSNDIPGQIVERLSYPWYNSYFTNVSFAGTQYRGDEQKFWPADRIGWRLFWPRMFGVNKSDWYFMAWLCGASNIKSDLILQPAM